MVNLTKYLLRIPPHELGIHLKRSFIDKLRVFVKSGNGGDGNKHLGGIGGNGGNIYMRAKSGITLRDVYAKNLKKRYIAENGEHSRRLKPYGENGEDVIIDVPCGVSAITDSLVNIGEVNQLGEMVLVSKGGKGGTLLNNYKGQLGQNFSVNLDLKLIADVGLIGFPNAGKSTLLSLVSKARPKIANYPFTTLNPQMGVIEYDDGRRISIADLPGIIEGAHFNRGMGHKFLKHISRTKINLFMIDINGFQLNQKSDWRTAFQTLAILNKELELYNSDLIDKPSLLLLNKMDTDDAAKRLDEFMEQYETYENTKESLDANWIPDKLVKFRKIIDISAKNNQNVEKMCYELREILDELDEQERQSKDEKNEMSNAVTH